MVYKNVQNNKTLMDKGKTALLTEVRTATVRQ